MRIKELKPIIFLLFLFAFFAINKTLDFREMIPKAQPVSEKKQAKEIVVNEEKTEKQTAQKEFAGTTEDIVSWVNKAREEEGLEALKENNLLNKSALAKAIDMKEKGYFEHVSPEGLQPWFFVEEVGYQYKTVGENLAEGYFSAEGVHEAWMNSKGHRENIVSDQYEEIGVAIVEIKKNGQQSFLIVQHFGSRLKKEDLKTINVCKEEVKDNCEEAEEKEEEVEDAIDEQKDIIKEAKKIGATEKDLQEAEENLDKLKDIEDDLEDYLDECKKYIKKCDKWIE